MRSLPSLPPSSCRWPLSREFTAMNFKTELSPWNMPELSWYYGFLFSCFDARVTIIMLFYFKKQKLALIEACLFLKLWDLIIIKMAKTIWIMVEIFLVWLWSCSPLRPASPRKSVSAAIFPMTGSAAAMARFVWKGIEIAHRLKSSVRAKDQTLSC